MKTFARSVAIITAFAVATRAIGFVFRIVLSRVLGAEMLGVYQIAMSFFMVFLTIIASGLPLAISKEVAKANSAGQKKNVLEIAIAGLIISLVSSAVLCALVLLGREFVGMLFTDSRCLNILIVLIPSVVASSVYTALRAVWWGEKKFFLLGATELLEQVLRVGFFAIMLAFSFLFVDTAQIAGLSFTIACFVSAIAVIVLFIRLRNKTVSKKASSKSEKFRNNHYESLIRSALPITGVRVIGSIAMPVISIIIPLRLVASGWTNVQAISQFGIAVGMTLPLLTIPGTIISALATALVPELSGSAQKNDQKAVHNQIQNALKFTLFITFLMLPVYIAIGQPIGVFLYDNQTAGAYLVQSSWVMIPLSLSQITNAILNSLGAESKALKHYIIGSVALFLFVWFGPQFFGVNSLLIGLGLCMGIAGVLNLFMINSMTKAHTGTLRLTLAFSLASIPSALLGLQLFKLAEHVWPLLISMGIAGAAAVLTLLLLCRVFNLIDFQSILPNRTKPKHV